MSVVALTNPLLSVTLAIVVVAIFAIAIRVRRTLLSSLKARPLPPGPVARSLWDSVMPTTNISTTFNEWADMYGPVITVRQGCSTIIVIARADAATEIMEKQGSSLGDRPPMIAADELLSGGKRITLTRIGERFRRLRKAVHTHLSAKASDTYRNAQLDQAKALVLDILDNPKNHQQSTRRFATSVVLRVMYGKSKTVSIDDPEFVGAKQAVAHFIEVMHPGVRHLVDHIPWLKYVPGYGRRLRSYYEADLKFFKSQLDRVQQDMASDATHLSFVKTLLENVQSHHLSTDEMAFLAGTLFEAGADTSAVGIIAMTMAAACFPDAQHRVQEELDGVVGMDRLPSWDDWDALPQLCAFISEALRWRPVTPFGATHRSTKNIIWKGYCIPAGTSVTANIWSITRDPVVFPNPERFDPQRWLDQHGRLRNDIECYPFGFGRRVCPGMHLANRSLFIALALLLWSFRIMQRPDAPIDTTPDRDNIVARPKAFVADFVPRIAVTRLREMMTTL